MMRACRRALHGTSLPSVSVNRDTTRQPSISREVGVWHFSAAGMRAFQAWCRERGVRAYKNVRMTRTPHFARCLRATRTLLPGQGIITCPASTCFNFLTVAREMASCASSRFPLELNWMNYDVRLPYLRSMCTYEIAMPGWMARIAAQDNNNKDDDNNNDNNNDDDSGAQSPAAPYIHYLLQDTRGRDGVAAGLSRERAEDSSRLEHVLSEMTADAGEEPEVYLELLMRAIACLHLRAQPIEAAAIATYMPGTNFFKAKVREMYVPTLMPLIDAVPQVEDGTHNCIVEYVAFRDTTTLQRQYADLQLDLDVHTHDMAGTSAAATTRATARRDEPHDHQQHEKDDAARRTCLDALLAEDAALLRGSGFFVLRALRLIEPGDVLYLRQYPRVNNGATERMQAQMSEAARLLSQDN